MANKIKKYLEFIEQKLLEYKNASEYDSRQIEADIQRHLIQIGFFQHERLIHLIVTVLFALLTVFSILYTISTSNISIFVLTIALLILLIPYIKHYYLMENSVQKMYDQYDEMLLYYDKANVTTQNIQKVNS